jgi:NAD(P)-dependent dehydrogenase (short-subunit alcohol dehydrogenase family)
MDPFALVTGADRGLGLALSAGLLERDWQVFAGQYMPDWPELEDLAGKYPQALHILPLDVSSIDSAKAAAQAAAEKTPVIDLLINNAGVTSPKRALPITDPQDYADMHRVFDINALGPLRVVEAFLPLTRTSRLKRLCFVSSEAGSISRTERTSWYSYSMSKAALNMGIKILFNHLHPAGYTFRVYHPGWVRSYMSGKKNLEATLEPEEAASYAIPILLGPREDETRLVLVDYQGQEWPW